MRVLLLSRYGDLGASSRVRYLQYLNEFKAEGWEVDVRPLFSNAYLEAFYAGQGRWKETVWGYLRRLRVLVHARQFDVLIIEKELFPFFPALFERLLARIGVRYVVDYDDALFHRYDLHSRVVVRRLLGRKIDAVMRNAAVVVAGNAFLADRARAAGARRIEVIPTVVDAKRYHRAPSMSAGSPIVGWIGTPKTSHYLECLLPVFEQLRNEVPVRFVAVGAREADFVGTPVETWSWSEETEVSSIQRFDIGIMPLPDSLWERGKCGYKLIQYMSCGLPVVASPVGVNKDIVIEGQNGYLAETLKDWHEKLAMLLQMPLNIRADVGKSGRKRVEAMYSLEVQAPRLMKVISDAVL